MLEMIANNSVEHVFVVMASDTTVFDGCFIGGSDCSGI